VAPVLDRSAVIVAPLVAVNEMAVDSWLVIATTADAGPLDVASVLHVHDPPIYLSLCSFLI